MEKSLPIWQIHPEIVGSLREGNRLVLVAPTGSGKTTQVPQMLLDAGLASPEAGPARKIVVLQPRRVAARTVASRVAWERGGKLGAEVGYQIRFEDHTSLGTRICFVTEGILLRWLQDDRALEDVAVVLFDEFHERNLLSDVALGLLKHLQKTARPDLKIVVMSATLDAKPVAAYLDGCPILESEGRSYGVEVYYQDYQNSRPVVEQAAEAIERIVRGGDTGDILVFMPGMGEINATIAACRAIRAPERLALIPLHGELQPEEQDLAFAPSEYRKVVVSTNVAETSVTIDGIRHVIDGGLARVARYDSERGIGTLLLEEISRASADQRKGRAGRTAPGTCHRLWTESNHLNRPERNTPEIQRSDLAEVVLLLHSLGIKKAAQFDWLDKPDPQAVQRAEDLLLLLGALGAAEPGATGGEPGNSDSDLTPVGRAMLRLPMHPRYSRMLVEAARTHCVEAAALCAALVGGRDLLLRVGKDDKHISEARELFEVDAESDFFILIRAFLFAWQNNFNIDLCRRYGIHAQTARQVEQTHAQIMGVVRGQKIFQQAMEKDPGLRHWEGGQAIPPAAAEPLLRCVMAGFVDQLCLRRDIGSLECQLTGGRTATLMRESVVHESKLFVAASIKEISGRGSGPLTLLGLASAAPKKWIEQMFPQHLTRAVEHDYDRTHKRVAAIRVTRFLDLVIDREHLAAPDPAESGRALAQAYAEGHFELPLFNHEIRQFAARVNLAAQALPELEIPPLNAEAISRCLGVAFKGLTLAKEAQALPLREAILRHLPAEQRQWLDELTPLSIPWPGEKRVKLTYVEPPAGKGNPAPAPELQVKIQECFQLKEHPRVCEGKVAVRLWICAPDGKRLESTLDWNSFRQHQYPKLKPALQKKFPSLLWV